jgi:hypothetical protein
MLYEPHSEAVIQRSKGLMWTSGIMDNMFRIKTLVTLLFPTLLYVSHTLQMTLTFKLLQHRINIKEKQTQMHKS